MRKRIGEILLSAGVIDEFQLRSALAEAARWGKRVGEVLVTHGHCTEEQILEGLANQLGVAIAPLSSTTAIPPRVLRLLPPAFARDKQALPLSLDGRTGTLEVAVTDPAGYELLDELRFRTGHEIRPLVAIGSELAAAIDHFYFGAPRERVAAPSAREALAIDLPEGDSDPDPFEHGLETGTVSDAGAARTGVARLEGRVMELQAQLDRAYGVLREAAIAHRALVAELAARGHVDRDSLARRVQAQKTTTGDGERG